MSKHAHWEYQGSVPCPESVEKKYMWTCSRCGIELETETGEKPPKTCNYCKAIMDGKEETARWKYAETVKIETAIMKFKGKVATCSICGAPVVYSKAYNFCPCCGRWIERDSKVPDELEVKIKIGAKLKEWLQKLKLSLFAQVKK